MKKLISVVVALFLVLLASVSFADTITVGDIEIEYNSIEDLQAIYSSVKERMVTDYKTLLLDADTYDAATYIVGETFPAGRYRVSAVVVSETNNDMAVKLLWWDQTALETNTRFDFYTRTGYVCAHWNDTVELTDGMRIEFDWDDDQRGVCIAMQLLPAKPESLMDIFD